MSLLAVPPIDARGSRVISDGPLRRPEAELRHHIRQHRSARRLGHPRRTSASGGARRDRVALDRRARGRAACIVFATRKKRVLVFDFDPQASLTIACGFEPHRLEKTVYDLLVDIEEELSPWTVIQATKTQEIRLLPSNIDLSNEEQQLVSQLSREHALKRFVDHLRGDFDLILIDCPPSLGLLMTNALTAADAVMAW